MSDHHEPKIDQTRLALAALAASIANALGEQFPTFLQAFDKELEKQFNSLKDAEVSNIGAIETLRWTRQFLREP